ncbi:MAG: hypothetical protein V2I33_18505, partial [Kangiellaceae bacterium]|nr:hypothetical protein [Kangiellaceae bacterium]
QDLHTADALPGSDVIICNPPWMPVTPTQDIELTTCDKGGKFLSRFLGLASRSLSSNGRILLFHSSYPAQLDL